MTLNELFARFDKLASVSTGTVCVARGVRGRGMGGGVTSELCESESSTEADELWRKVLFLKESLHMY